MISMVFETRMIFGFPIDKVGDYVIYLIVGLFAVALLTIVKNSVRTFMEKRHLATAVGNFHGAESRVNSAEEIVRITKEGLPDCIIRKRIDLLFKIRQLQSISTDLISRLDHLEETENYRFVRFVLSVLLVLGLLGTAIGLTLSVQGIMPAIKQTQQVSDISILTKAMAETMEGLGTAFNATLAALFTTFVLAALVLFAQRYEASFHHKLESFLASDLMPKILISTEQEAATLYVEAVRNSAEDIAKAADTLDRSREGIQVIVEGLVQSTKASENRIVDFFNFAQSFRDSVNQLIGYNDDLKKVYKDIQNIFVEMKDNQVTHTLIGEIVDSSVKRALSEANESAQIIRQTFKADMVEMMKSQQEYIGAVNRTTDAIKKFSQENAESFSHVLSEGFRETLIEFKQGLHQAKERESVSRGVAGEALEAFRKYVEETTRIQGQNRSELEKTHARMGEALEQFKRFIQDASQSQQKIVERLNHSPSPPLRGKTAEG